MRVYIIGAGPGDPRLLTLRAAELIERCPVVLYTGSLVPKAAVARARLDAKVLDSSGMTRVTRSCFRALSWGKSA